VVDALALGFEPFPKKHTRCDFRTRVHLLFIATRVGNGTDRPFGAAYDLELTIAPNSRRRVVCFRPTIIRR